MRTTQSAVARLEAGGVSPSLRTLEKAYMALGYDLRLVPVSAVPGSAANAGNERVPAIDMSQIRRNLGLTPRERLIQLAAAYRGLQRLKSAAGVR